MFIYLPSIPMPDIKAEFYQMFREDGHAVNSQFKSPPELPSVDKTVITKVYEGNDNRFDFGHEEVTSNVRRITIEGSQSSWEEYIVPRKKP